MASRHLFQGVSNSEMPFGISLTRRSPFVVALHSELPHCIVFIARKPDDTLPMRYKIGQKLCGSNLAYTTSFIQERL